MTADRKPAKVRALRSLIFLHFDSETECANALGWHKQKLNKITNGLMEPNINDVNELAKLLGVPVGDMANIFLRQRSPNGQQGA